MLGSAVLDVLVGMSAVYVFLGVITAFVTDFIAARTWAEESLKHELKATFGEKCANAMRTSPICAGGPLLGVAAGAFTLVLIDTLRASGKQVSKRAILPDAVRVVAVAADSNQLKLTAGLEALVLSAMSRARRKTRLLAVAVALSIGILITVSLDIDSLQLATAFWQEQAVRAAVNGAAQAPSGTGLEDAFNVLSQQDLPIGWSNPPQTNADWLLKVIGLTLSSLGVWAVAVIAGQVRSRLARHGLDGTSTHGRAEAERWDALLGLPALDSK